MECRLITDVKYQLIDNPNRIIYKIFNNTDKYFTEDEMTTIFKHDFGLNKCIKTEYIYPVQYIDPKTNEKIWIGMTKEVYDILRLPYEVIHTFENTLKTIKSRIEHAKMCLAYKWKDFDKAKYTYLEFQGQYGTYHELADKVTKFENMSIWEFIKFKFRNWLKQRRYK